jgi:dTDP-4-amino-4,6-dideoxygalactose transaminase
MLFLCNGTDVANCDDVDVDLYNMNISIDAIRESNYTQNKSNSTCSLVWRAANRSYYGIAKEHNLYVIEDNAQAIGANCKFSTGIKRKRGR